MMDKYKLTQDELDRVMDIGVDLNIDACTECGATVGTLYLWDYGDTLCGDHARQRLKDTELEQSE